MIYSNGDYRELLKELHGRRIILFGSGNIARSFVASINAALREMLYEAIEKEGIFSLVKECTPVSIASVIAFAVDNDKKKKNTTFEVLGERFEIFEPAELEKIEELDKKYVLVITSRFFIDISIQLLNMPCTEKLTFFVSELSRKEPGSLFWDEILNRRIYEERLRYYKQKLSELKNTKRGKRCFIIGNGPSLTIRDLEMLSDEDSFAVNRIYLMFEKTNWRPTYYCVIDKKHLMNSLSEITNVKVEKKFIPLLVLQEQGHDIEDAVFFNIDHSPFYPALPSFSDDISDRIYDGMTVTYSLIQIAVYMGYQEIYLLGQDHSFSRELLPDGTIKLNQGVKNYFSEGYTKSDDNPGAISHMDLAYERARMYCEEHGIIIKNATRGGKLEIFERVDFDALFK